VALPSHSAVRLCLTALHLFDFLAALIELARSGKPDRIVQRPIPPPLYRGREIISLTL
jgi:hypothetical protein